MSEEYDLEAVYDEKVYPLMKQIIDICQEHQMPFVASFQYVSDGEDDHGLCSSAYLPDTRPIAAEYNKIWDILRPRRPAPVPRLTTWNADGQITQITHVVP